MKKVYSGSFEGINAKTVSVETSFSNGLPSFSIVGLGGNEIQESRDRVKSALSANEYIFPPKRVTTNLSPSDLRKSGTHFDLSIALLIALQNEEINFEEFYIFGELGLDGEVKETSSLFALVLSLAQSGELEKALVPSCSLKKLSCIPNVQFYGVNSLKECIEFFQSKTEKVPSQVSEFNFPFLQTKEKKLFYNKEYDLDFCDVKGQEFAKRAAMISAAGMHNILLTGSPGCGKSMIAKRLQYILPPLDMNEVLDNAKLDALEGIEPIFKPLRAFRHPHHSSTPEVSLEEAQQVLRLERLPLLITASCFLMSYLIFKKTFLKP